MKFSLLKKKGKTRRVGEKSINQFFILFSLWIQQELTLVDF